jgi:hypothetical protein
MKPKFRVILEQAIEEGVCRGYYNGYNNADLNINFDPNLLFHI